MIFALKDFQREAVDKLKRYFSFYFDEKDRKTIVFKSPTGSGKTFMASSLFEGLANEYGDVNFCVLWCCPGKGELQKQSFENVKYYLGGNPTCTLLEDSFFGSRKYIKKHEIVFVNWEKLVQKDKETGGWANNLMKDQEGMNFIDVIDQTKKNNTKIILVIDESHIGASAQSRIKEFIETVVYPDIVLKMSATPLDSHIDVEVDPEKVIEEGLIKKDVIVNEGISAHDRNLEDKDSEQIILEKGYEKRLELLNRYREIGSIVNPLVLIQIPNVDEGEAKKLVIKDFLRSKGITEENGLLKLWCDNSVSFDKKKIRQIDDKTEFLIFKTAVATGWDCPRAQILIKFREGHSETFEIQTIGRILRTVEAKSYDDEVLDNAYIFTNIKEFETKKDTYNPNRIKTLMSYINKKFSVLDFNESTSLKSFYRSREGNYNSADSRFYGYYKRAFMDRLGFTPSDEITVHYDDRNEERFKEKGVNLDLNTSDAIISETVLRSSRIDREQDVSGGLATVKMSDNDIEAVFNNLIKDNLNGLAYIRSKSPITGAIIEVFSLFYYSFERSERAKSVQRIVVNNYSIFAGILSEATLKFRELLEEDATMKGTRYDFRIETKKAYSSETHKELEMMPKSFYQPLYVLMDDHGRINELEKSFLKYLEEQEEVIWYWENGAEQMRTNFGISYNNGLNTFQPDFIIKFKHNYIGIFDTKAESMNFEDTKAKAEALQRFIASTNSNRGYHPKVIGIKYNNEFYVNTRSEYKKYTDSPSDWIVFDDLIAQINCGTDLEYYLKRYFEK